VIHRIFDGLYRRPADPRDLGTGLWVPQVPLLAFEQPVFRTSAIVGLLFLGILAAEAYQRRFWCRNLCPLGALLALLGRFGLFRRRITRKGAPAAACANRTAAWGRSAATSR